jgi:alpha-1,2-mannosyltransferase
LDTLLFGQVNLLLLAMILMDTLMISGRYRGILVGLATGIKLTPGLFIVYFVITGQRREARNATLALAVTVLAGFLVQPSSAWAFWTKYMLDPARTGNVTYSGNQSILATVARLTRNADPPQVLTLGLTIGVVAVALLLARRLYLRREVLPSVCVIGVATVLASPISWTHHWVWCIPCVGVVAAWTRDAPRSAPFTSVLRWSLVAIATLVVSSGPTRFVPLNNLRELHHNLGQQIVGNSYVLLAAAFLLAAMVHAYSLRPNRQIPILEPSVPRTRQRPSTSVTSRQGGHPPPAASEQLPEADRDKGAAVAQ